MRKAIVIMNEQHTLLPEQEQIITNTFGSWEFLKVPASGWTLEEQKKIKDTVVNGVDLHGAHGKAGSVVFVSPVPYLYGRLQLESGYFMGSWDGNCGAYGKINSTVYVFHNDKREKKELPNGKIINVVAKTGWVLV